MSAKLFLQQALGLMGLITVVYLWSLVGLALQM